MTKLNCNESESHFSLALAAGTVTGAIPLGDVSVVNLTDSELVAGMDAGDVDTDIEQLELFFAERLDATWKPREDLHSLEYPLFSLQKSKDTRVRVFRNGDQIVRIIPSVVGAANIFDKDLLVYAATQICKAADANQPVSRRIRFKVRDFLLYMAAAQAAPRTLVSSTAAGVSKARRSKRISTQAEPISRSGAIVSLTTMG